MKDSKKKWSVTYTRHIKQKRKVYKDGYLHLEISTNKLLLFDDSENLLECRLLKTDELVSPGETLSFHSHLVDIGDPCSEDFNFNVHLKKENEVNEVPRVIHRRKFRSPSICSGDRKDNNAKEFDARNLSSSEKIFREFKKREFERYGSQKCSLDTSNSRVKEWQVLFTTHLTQKAKKYHDGFLQLVSSGSFGRQIYLYDACRKLLTSRFLKADETLVSGEPVSLDGYLVEIGESQGDRKPKVNLNSQRSNCNSYGDTKTRLAQESKHQSNISGKEWKVMYTTQLTQKAKKYHDGFLSLENCGSLAQKILLYDSSKTLLNNRFLKKDEMISAGESVAFDAHLVDIDEPVDNNKPKEGLKVEGHDLNVSGKTVKTKTLENRYEAKEPVEKEKMGKSQNIACFKQDVDSRKTTKPLRDAQQILAFLQRPVGVESNSMSNSAKTEAPPVSHAKGLVASEVDKGVFEKCPTSRVLPPNFGHSENHDTKESNMTSHMGKTSIVSSSKATSTFSSNASDHSNFDAKIHQSQLGNTETGTINSDEAFACVKKLSSAHTDGPNDQTKSSEQREMDEWPSFDLGF